jgi:acetamidase/formamidase
MKIVLSETVDFINQIVPATDARGSMIASVAVDDHVTQVVEGTKGSTG